MATKKRTITKAVNMDKLIEELSPIGLNGVNFGVDGSEVSIITDVTFPEATIDALVAGILAHDPTAKTAAQIEDAQERADVSVLLGQIDTAIADIATKKAALQATANLANASALLIELAQDTTGILKAMKRIIKRLS